jgi:hypothetical protein
MTTLEIKKTNKLKASSLIKSMVYDKQKCQLMIEFKSGTKYLYRDVPQSVIKRMSSSKSLGSFFHDNIREVYSFKRVE